MSNLRLKINIEPDKFPDTGIPLPYKMKDPDKVTNNGNPVKMKMNIKSEYKSAFREIDGAATSFTDIQNMISVSGGKIEGSFEYIEGVPHTYKFLGMDIDDEYRAIIPIGDGCIVVANMFDTKEIQSARIYERRVEPTVLDAAVTFIRRMSEGTVRKLSTAMKSGGLYDLYKKSNGSYISVKDTFDFFSNLMSSSSGVGSENSFKSILLNLVHESESSKMRTISKGSQDSDAVEIIVALKCLEYWKTVVNKYNNLFSILSGIDIWQHVSKKVLGDDRFNSMLNESKAIKIEDADGIKEARTAIISGVSRNMSISDNTLVRLGAVKGLEELKRTLVGNGTEKDSLQDLVISCIETENIENPFELSIEEIQALSNYDSLQFIDEDAKLCADSYNMNDPDERGMFIRSAISSYEKNFKAYKPKNNYDVTEAMAEMVENKDVLKTKIVSADISTEEDDSGYITTSSTDEIRNSFNKQALLKVSKLIGKQLISIKGMFQ